MSSNYDYGRDYGGAYEDRAMPAMIYVLYILGMFHGLTLIIGLIMAYALRGSAGPANASHYTYQIRTFWTALAVGLICAGIMLVGFILSFILIGIPILWAGGVACLMVWLWAMIRSIIGLVRLSQGAPIMQPYGMAF
jgi:uncharacterized membrane protein